MLNPSYENPVRDLRLRPHYKHPDRFGKLSMVSDRIQSPGRRESRSSVRAKAELFAMDDAAKTFIILDRIFILIGLK